MRYVFIDEIQDYTPFQLAYLKFSFPRAKFTLLGDLNQAIFTKENSKTLLSELSTMFDRKDHGCAIDTILPVNRADRRLYPPYSGKR